MDKTYWRESSCQQLIFTKRETFQSDMTFHKNETEQV